MMQRKFVMMFIVIALIVGSAPVAAQEETETLVVPTPTADGQNVTQIFRVAHADVKDIAEVISLFGGAVRPIPDLGVIAWTGPTTQLPAVEAAIRSLDVAPVPEPNVELMIYFLIATREGEVAADMPAALDGVVVQLQDVFGYSGIGLLEVTAMRVRNGSRGEIDGILPSRRIDEAELRYSFGFRKLRVTENASGRSIRLDMLSAGVQAPHTVMENGQSITRYMRTGINTDIDLREGQKAVIGKTSIEGGAETVFVVVTGTIIE